MSTVVLEHVTVTRDGAVLLDAIDLDVADGELVGVVGRSGAGKTTLLRVIGGLEQADAGSVRLDGTEVNGIAAAHRGVAMVFQGRTLLPQRDVRGNVAFPLELRDEAKDEIRRRVTAETRALHIQELLGRQPRQLSAGEAQLVQIARALVRMPALLLLDEPLAGLDHALAQRMRHELRVLQRGYGVTTFLATNDPIEAMSMPDRLVVVDHGHVVQDAAPDEVYDRPGSLAAATCTGTMSTFTARVDADVDGYWLVRATWRHRAWAPAIGAYAGGEVLVGVRPRWGAISGAGDLAATVTAIGVLAGTITVAFEGGPAAASVELAVTGPAPRVGEAVTCRLERVAVFDPVSGVAIA